MSTLYHTLGVEPSASMDEIKTAFKRAALANHPDKTVGLRNSEQMLRAEMFKLVYNAYEVLSDPARREAYDEQLHPVQRGHFRRASSLVGHQHARPPPSPDSRSAPAPRMRPTVNVTERRIPSKATTRPTLFRNISKAFPVLMARFRDPYWKRMTYGQWDFVVLVPHCFYVRDLQRTGSSADSLVLEVKMQRTKLKTNEPEARHVYVVLNTVPAMIDCVRINCTEMQKSDITLTVTFYGAQLSRAPRSDTNWIFELDIDYHDRAEPRSEGWSPLRAYVTVLKEYTMARKSSLELFNFIVKCINQHQGSYVGFVCPLASPAMHSSFVGDKNVDGGKKKSWTLDATVSRPPHQT